MATAHDEAAQLRDQYRTWRRHLSLKRTGFFAVYSPFVDKFFTELSPGAVKLFVYLGRYAGNYTGEVFHPISRMAKDLGVTQRTVKTWADELETNGLIRRLRLKPGGVSHTFLLPYTPAPQKEEPGPEEDPAHDDNSQVKPDPDPEDDPAQDF